MPTYDHMHNHASAPLTTRHRPAPRCYTRQAVFRTTEQSRVEADTNLALLALGIATFVAVFLAVYGGWVS